MGNQEGLFGTSPWKMVIEPINRAQIALLKNSVYPVGGFGCEEGNATGFSGPPTLTTLIKRSCALTLLVLVLLSTIVIALGGVSISLGLGIRHPVRGAVALTIGGLVVLAGMTLMYKALQHKKLAGRADSVIVNAEHYFNYRNRHLVRQPTNIRIKGSGGPIKPGQKPVVKGP